MTVSDYLRRLAERSRTPQHELVLECLEHFGLCGTQELTLEQAAEWWEIVRRR
ncbi:MAG: hypothetical protein PHV18_11090 [Lachnospiraceae bacterium]|nr:hypothetical protein [Lachnospiraceae bacterium]